MKCGKIPRNGGVLPYDLPTPCKHFLGNEAISPSVWDTHEEKETDVNFGIHLVDKAHKNQFDKALILTADTDLVPAIKLVRQTFPEKDVDAVIPELRFQNALELRNACSNAKRIKEHHIERNLFPEKIEDSNGNIITRPESYKPPIKRQR